MTADRLDDLLALAALGELTEIEQRELDALLLTDASLAAELDADLAVAAGLQRVHADEPPATLRSDVLAAISDVAQEPNTAGDAGTIDLAARRRLRRPWLPLAAAAAVLGLFVGGVVLTAQRTDPSPIEEIASAPDAVTRVLEGELDGELRVVFSPSQDAFVIEGNGVPPLSDDQTYQLWFVDDDGPQSVGLFRPDDSGRVAERFDRDPSGTVVGVTIEPAAGSDAPTLPIVAAA